MKIHSLALVLLASTAASPVFAADIQAVSRIDAVTVFPSGAEVTRIAEAKIEAGEHALIFEGLPGDLVPETIRVEGDAPGDVEIGSVDSKITIVPSADVDARRKLLGQQIEALQDERGALDQAITDAEYQKSLMQQLASGAFTAPTKEGPAKSFGANDLGQLLDLVGGKLQALSKLVLDAKVRQRQIDQQMTDLQNQIDALAPQQEAKTTVSVHLAAPAAVSGTFRVKYRIANAGWQPLYDARLTSPAKDTAAAIELVRRAAVTQYTTEAWDGVTLTLSTARPAGATAAPDIEAQQINIFDPRPIDGFVATAPQSLESPAPVARAVGEAGNTVAKDASKLDEPKLKKAEQRQADVQIAGFQALYEIPGRVTVANTGGAKNVRIATSKMEAQLTARTVPKLDPNAYLTAAFTLSGETPLLPGTAMLYRDGVFMGQGYLPMLSPGEEAKLGFGADDLIKVKRAEVNRQRGEEGLISTSNTDQRAYDITVRNLHDFKLPVTVVDQMPYATQVDVTVETLPGMTPATLKDLDRKRGVMAWSFDLEPRAEKLVKHGFKVSWPENMQVGMNID